MSEKINKYIETHTQEELLSLSIGVLNRLLVDKGIATKEELFQYLEKEIDIDEQEEK